MEGRTSIPSLTETPEDRLLPLESASFISGNSTLGAQLIHAAEAGDIDAVNRLLRYRAPVNWTDEEGATALHWAAENGHVEVVKWLLVVPDIDVDARTPARFNGFGLSFSSPMDGMSPLLMAVKRGNYPIARLLLEGRPQLEAMAIVDDLCGKIMFASEGATALYMAVTSGSVELAELLLTFGAPPNEPLIVRTADPDAGTVETSLYALHAAVRMGDFAMASLLIAFNANVDASIQFTTDEGFSVVDGGTALYGAVNDLQLEMVELLLAAGASPNISGRIPGPDGSVVDGWTALHAAVSHGNAEMVELLVDRGANLDATTSTTSPGGESISEGMTAMCAAAQRGMADIVKARAARRLSALLLVRHLPDSCPAILVQGGGDFNAPAKFQSADGVLTEACIVGITRRVVPPFLLVTVLSAAVQAAEIEIIDLLLDYDADVPEGTAILIDESFDEAKRARAEEANAKLAEAAELTLERARTREAQHSYVLQQRREAREREEAERREREQAAKKEALLKEERRAKAAMEMLLVRAKKDATDELAVIKSLPGGAAKSTRIRKLRAKYHPDRNLPGMREQFTELSAFVNMETDKVR